MSDLFKAMLMISANDAAMSLAQATGSVSKGVAMMNAEAHHLQADDTVAKRPNGLNGPGQHVSAYDEALFARQALAIPEFMHDEQLRTMRFPLKPHHKPVTLYTQNTMLGHLPGGPRREDRLDHGVQDHLHRLGPPERPHAGRDHPALQAADRDDLRGPAAELGLRHGREGQAGRRPGRPAARASGRAARAPAGTPPVPRSGRCRHRPSSGCPAFRCWPAWARSCLPC